MTNFDILDAKQLLNITGGHNEITDRDVLDDAIV